MIKGKTAKNLMLLQLLVFLVPLTLYFILLVILSYPAYPLPNMAAIQIAFDVVMAVCALAIVSAWRLSIGFLRSNSNPKVFHRHWWRLFSLGALVGLLSCIIAIEQTLRPGVPEARIGLALLSPMLLLAPVWLQLFLQSRKIS